METCLAALIFFIYKKLNIMKTYFDYVLLCIQNKMETSFYQNNKKQKKNEAKMYNGSERRREKRPKKGMPCEGRREQKIEKIKQGVRRA